MPAELADVVASPRRDLRDLQVEHAGFRPDTEVHLPLPVPLQRQGIDDSLCGTICNPVSHGKKAAQSWNPGFIEVEAALFSDAAHARPLVRSAA